MGHPLFGYFGMFLVYFGVCPSSIRKCYMNFSTLILFFERWGIALAITEVKQSAVSSLLFCNRQDLLSGFVSVFGFLDADRHEWKKQAQYATFEQTWLHVSKYLLNVLIFDLNRHASACREMLSAIKIKIFFNLRYLFIGCISVLVFWMQIEINKRNHHRVFIWSKSCLFANAKAFF